MTFPIKEKLSCIFYVVERMQNALKCSICLDLLSSPVTTKCGHSFCGSCVNQIISSKKTASVCPLCMKAMTRRSLNKSMKLIGFADGVRDIIKSIKEDLGYEDHQKMKKVGASLNDDDDEVELCVGRPQKGEKYSPENRVGKENLQLTLNHHSGEPPKASEDALIMSRRKKSPAVKPLTNEEPKQDLRESFRKVEEWLDLSYSSSARNEIHETSKVNPLSTSDLHSEVSIESQASASTIFFGEGREIREIKGEVLKGKKGRGRGRVLSAVYVSLRGRRGKFRDVNKAEDVKKEPPQKGRLTLSASRTEIMEVLEESVPPISDSFVDESLHPNINNSVDTVPEFSPEHVKTSQSKASSILNKCLQQHPNSKGHNIRFASEVKCRLLEKPTPTAVKRKMRKSPGWSHIEGVKMNLRSKKNALQIKGGEARNVTDGGASKSFLGFDISSQESLIVIEDQSQKTERRNTAIEALNDVTLKKSVDKYRRVERSSGRLKGRSNQRRNYTGNSLPECSTGGDLSFKNIEETAQSVQDQSFKDSSQPARTSEGKDNCNVKPYTNEVTTEDVFPINDGIKLSESASYYEIKSKSTPTCNKINNSSSKAHSPCKEVEFSSKKVQSPSPSNGVVDCSSKKVQSPSPSNGVVDCSSKKVQSPCKEVECSFKKVQLSSNGVEHSSKMTLTLCKEVECSKKVPSCKEGECTFTNTQAQCKNIECSFKNAEAQSNDVECSMKKVLSPCKVFQRSSIKSCEKDETASDGGLESDNEMRDGESTRKTISNPRRSFDLTFGSQSQKRRQKIQRIDKEDECLNFKSALERLSGCSTKGGSPIGNVSTILFQSKAGSSTSSVTTIPFQSKAVSLTSNVSTIPLQKKAGSSTGNVSTILFQSKAGSSTSSVSTIPFQSKAVSLTSNVSTIPLQKKAGSSTGNVSTILFQSKAGSSTSNVSTTPFRRKGKLDDREMVCEHSLPCDMFKTLMRFAVYMTENYTATASGSCFSKVDLNEPLEVPSWKETTEPLFTQRLSHSNVDKDDHPKDHLLPHSLDDKDEHPKDHLLPHSLDDKDEHPKDHLLPHSLDDKDEHPKDHLLPHSLDDKDEQPKDHLLPHSLDDKDEHPKDYLLHHSLDDKDEHPKDHLLPHSPQKAADPILHLGNLSELFNETGDCEGEDGSQSDVLELSGNDNGSLEPLSKVARVEKSVEPTSGAVERDHHSHSLLQHTENEQQKELNFTLNRNKLKRIKPLPSDSSSDEDFNHRKTSQKKKRSNEDSQNSVRSNKTVTSEEMRDFGRYDDNIWDYYRRESFDGVQSSALREKLGKKCLDQDVETNWSDDGECIPGTAEVLKLVRADVELGRNRAKSDKSASCVNETINLVSQTSSVTTQFAELPPSTSYLIKKCDQSLHMAEGILRDHFRDAKSSESAGNETQACIQEKAPPARSLTKNPPESPPLPQEEGRSTKEGNIPFDADFFLSDSDVESEELFKTVATTSSKTRPPAVWQVEARKKQDCMTLLYTGLTDQEVAKLRELILSVCKPGSRLSSSWSKDVTHLIAKANSEGVTDRTLKYLYGVAHGIWVVSFSWVVDSINSSVLLPEDEYEVLDCTSFPGPKMGRMRKTPLFQNCQFFLHSPFTNITKEQLQELISVCGGEVISDLHSFDTSNTGLKVVAIDSNVHTDNVMDELMKNGKALLSYDWILECVGMSILIALQPYLLGKPSAPVLEASGITAALLTETQDIM